ncbi:hypothetical protein BDV27DRAFT_164459 [Aspergillus caelatus]|uniref:Major facilitator superfamily (MFS) profile domain-containing protein n=1 Tax=Aspergillus caelatus TaxID=61420 RepID=A0A5N6ZJE5_9EURO|nr:uncharacterized protein BDV27DRAFT_164459 [Aspergillus caelatus]KAE8357498.1 hypothetical protein BDV27DRAFT_164459 [Aspergillus caelatus]
MAPIQCQLSCFYEPLVLLYTLGQTRGEYTGNIHVGESAVSLFNNTRLRRTFLSQLAWQETASHHSKNPPSRHGEDEGLGSAQSARDEYVYIADGYGMIRRIIFIITVCSSMFTNQLGLCNSLMTLEIIGESFGVTDPGKLSWTIAGYGLTLGTFISIGRCLGDEFGNKAIFIIGMGWLALTSMMAGSPSTPATPSTSLLVSCRALVPP